PPLNKWGRQPVGKDPTSLLYIPPHLEGVMRVEGEKGDTSPFFSSIEKGGGSGFESRRVHSLSYTANH
ncbi:MAG: hypothetical protein ACP5H8_03845, partial [Candidatus Micrarchaeia archaeon]